MIVVHTLDRLGRTVRDTLNLIHELSERGIGVAAFRGELLRRYQSLRRFLPTLPETVSFDAAPAGQPVLDALQSLRAWKGIPAASAPARCR